MRHSHLGGQYPFLQVINLINKYYKFLVFSKNGFKIKKLSYFFAKLVIGTSIEYYQLQVKNGRN